MHHIIKFILDNCHWWCDDMRRLSRSKAWLPSCVWGEMSLCVEGFESWLIEMETHTFCSDIAHPGGHREMANPAILYFTSSRPPLPIYRSICGKSLPPLHWVNSKQNQEWRRVLLRDRPSEADNAPPGRRREAGSGVSEGWAGRETNRVHEATNWLYRPWKLLLPAAARGWTRRRAQWVTLTVMSSAHGQLRPEDVHGSHHVLPADGALAHPLPAFGAGYHVTALQQHAVDDGVHADSTQVLVGGQLSLDTICWGDGQISRSFIRALTQQMLRLYWEPLVWWRWYAGTHQQRVTDVLLLRYCVNSMTLRLALARTCKHLPRELKAMSTSIMLL